MLSLKPGVRLLGLKPEMAMGNQIIHSVFVSHNKNCVITCGVDGQHSIGSKHYSGNALDYRTRHLLASEREAIQNDCRGSLGADFDFIFEGDHFHCEYDPKTPL